MTRLKVFNVVIGYPAIAQPESYLGGEPKYKCTIFLDKETQSDQIQALDQVGKIIHREKLTKTPFNKLRYFLRDGDEEYPDNSAYRGRMFFNASTSIKYQPQVVDRKLQPVDPAKLYSGCICNVSVSLFLYTEGGAGIAAALGNIQVINLETPRILNFSAEDDFEELETEDNGDFEELETDYTT